MFLRTLFGNYLSSLAKTLPGTAPRIFCFPLYPGADMAAGPGTKTFNWKKPGTDGRPE
jgi:hypothetical protein